MKASPTTTSKKRGRKTILDAKLQKQICDLLAAGNTIKTCCDAVGIAERTYFDWCEQHPHFAQATTRARARSKIKLVKIITDAAMVDARHAEWLLERCHPSEFRRCTQVTGKDGAPLIVPDLPAPKVVLIVEKDSTTDEKLAIAHGRN
jgi:hypothetical protein